GILDGLDYQTLFNLNKDFLYPDQIFLLDLPAQVAIARLKLNNEKPEYFEKEKNLAIVRQEYLKMSSNLPSFQVIDANQDRQFIAREIRNYFYDLPPTT
ncbi:hypothetical protein HY061_00575, partial [Candidatus Azambacteria bacterium]|nr:hypothetical protein [Candidatus Azambacteria bacterium]